MKLWVRLAAVTAVCMLAGIALSVFLLATWLHAPSHHVTLAMRYLLESGLISLAIGILSLLAILRFAPTLGIKVAAACLAGSAAATINVMVTPLLMFSEQSDKIILAITLLYFLVLSLAFAAIVGVVTTRQIHALRDGAVRIAAGDFRARVEVQGIDEVADLGRAFNRMSTELGASFERERGAETERRELMAAISHDLRTPLASIRAMVEAINDGVVTAPHEVRHYTGLIQAESEHLGRLIDDLFELSRIENGNLDLRMTAIPLSELVTETVDGMQIHAHERGIELHTVMAGEMPLLTLDGPRIQRVLVNLINNALHYTERGGQVGVEVKRIGNEVELAVCDTGEGIAPEEQAHVFERFYRGDKSRTRGGDAGGAGLGLAIARAIVEAHRGSITVESTPGAGSRFVVTLPG